MITETYGGCCPVCDFDRMMMRYGSHGWWQFDACPRCGFAYGSNGHQHDNDPMEVWKAILESDGRYMKEILKLPLTIDGVYQWMLNASKPDPDAPNSVFTYTEDFLEKFKQSKLYKERSIRIKERMVFT